MGMGVTGGNPEGFNIGLEPGNPGSIGMRGIDLVGAGVGVGAGSGGCRGGIGCWGWGGCRGGGGRGGVVW